jgi:anti-sigma-K factor RskA
MTTPAPNNPELDALLGAYALDALDPDERALVEEYIAANPHARDEVDELRESAASLALAPIDDTTAPADLWERISATIEGEHLAQATGDERDDHDDHDELAARRARRGRSGRWLSIVTVAAAVAAILLAAQVISLNHRLHDSRTPGERNAAAAFERAGRVKGARQVALTPAQGAEVARVVLLPDGSGYLKNDGLAPLDAEHTYQLWALTGNVDHPIAISAGVLGRDPEAAAFSASTDVKGFALTIEKAGGVPQSAQAPYASAGIA